MKSSAKDKAKDAFHEAKGKAKELAGKITYNPTLEAKGKAEKIAGKMQEKVGRGQTAGGLAGNQRLKREGRKQGQVEG
jgi:uncharacterized protein YjbJ (UPF0337 family)